MHLRKPTEGSGIGWRGANKRTWQENIRKRMRSCALSALRTVRTSFLESFSSASSSVNCFSRSSSSWTDSAEPSAV